MRRSPIRSVSKTSRRLVTISRDCETMPATRMTEAMNFDRS
jgi:hypothetical protein